MYYSFRSVIKDINARGWRLENDDGRYYLSKFEEQFNDNEIRVFIEFNENEIVVKRCMKYKWKEEGVKIVKMKSKDNPYLIKAHEICKAYIDSKKVIVQ